MYDLILKLFFGANATAVPQNVNTTLMYVAAALALLVTCLLVDLVFRLLKSVFGRSQY